MYASTASRAVSPRRYGTARFIGSARTTISTTIRMAIAPRNAIGKRVPVRVPGIGGSGERTAGGAPGTCGASITAVLAGASLGEIVSRSVGSSSLVGNSTGPSELEVDKPLTAEFSEPQERQH